MKKLIWDLPTRIFHWLFAGSFLIAFIIAKTASKESPTFYLHVVFAVLAGLLLLWRLYWGLKGTRHALFKNLYFTPTEVLKYMKAAFSGQGAYFAGHNPGGGAVALKMLSLVFLTILSGVFIAQGEVFEELHEILPLITMAFVVVHIIGVLLATKTHNENYALAMVTGYKRAEVSDQIENQATGSALLMVALTIGTWIYFISGFDRETGLFTAPGTSFQFQVGESEESEDGDRGEGEKMGSAVEKKKELDGANGENAVKDHEETDDDILKNESDALKEHRDDDDED